MTMLRHAPRHIGGLRSAVLFGSVVIAGGLNPSLPIALPPSRKGHRRKRISPQRVISCRRSIQKRSFCSRTCHSRKGVTGIPPVSRRGSMVRNCPASCDGQEHCSSGVRGRAWGPRRAEFATGCSTTTGSSTSLRGVTRSQPAGSPDHVSHRRPMHLDREVVILWLQQRKAAEKTLKWTGTAWRTGITLWRSVAHSAAGKAMDAAGASEEK